MAKKTTDRHFLDNSNRFDLGTGCKSGGMADGMDRLYERLGSDGTTRVGTFFPKLPGTMSSKDLMNELIIKLNALFREVA